MNHNILPHIPRILEYIESDLRMSNNTFLIYPIFYLLRDGYRFRQGLSGFMSPDLVSRPCKGAGGGVGEKYFGGIARTLLFIGWAESEHTGGRKNMGPKAVAWHISATWKWRNPLSFSD